MKPESYSETEAAIYTSQASRVLVPQCLLHIKEPSLKCIVQVHYKLGHVTTLLQCVHMHLLQTTTNGIYTYCAARILCMHGFEVRHSQLAQATTLHGCNLVG